MTRREVYAARLAMVMFEVGEKWDAAFVSKRETILIAASFRRTQNPNANNSFSMNIAPFDVKQRP